MSVACSMVYSMPAQPPFFTPILRPLTSPPSISALIRAMAAGVSVTGSCPGTANMSRLLACPRDLVGRGCRHKAPCPASHQAEFQLRLVAQLVEAPGRLPNQLHVDRLDARQ